VDQPARQRTTGTQWGAIGMDAYVLASQILSVGMSIVAVAVAYLAFRLSQHAVNLQIYSRYFEANMFQLENWEVVTPLTPLGKCSSRQEAVIKTYLLHRLNRFRWDSDKKQRNMHKVYARMMFGLNLREFQENLQKKGANEEVSQLAVRTLRAIRFDDPYFASDRRFWDEYFGRTYFDEPKHA
jgi:hypothetical protein